MEISNIMDLVNSAAKESMGSEAIKVKDTSTLVSTGEKVLSSEKYLSRFYSALVDRIGKTVTSIKTYNGADLGIRKDTLEWGIITQKLNFKMPEAGENPIWSSSKRKSPYDINTTLKVESAYYASANGFSFDSVILDKQLKQSFTGPAEMGAFVNGIYTAIKNAYTLSVENSERLALATGIAVSLNAGGMCAINLLSEYNTSRGVTLTTDEALRNPDFLKYCSLRINTITNLMGSLSTAFNPKGWQKFTTKDEVVVNMLDLFVKNMETYLTSDVYHKDLIRLPNYKPVQYWQAVKGTSMSYDFNTLSTINIKNKIEEVELQKEQSGIVAYVHAPESVSTCVYDTDTASHYNQFDRRTAYQLAGTVGYICDLFENGVVFYIA